MKNLTPQEMEYLHECRKLESQCKWQWLQAIDFSPRLAQYCNCFDKFNTGEWAVLLSHCPEFCNLAPLHKLSANEWTLILHWQPQLTALCPIQERLSDQQKAFIKSPEFK